MRPKEIYQTKSLKRTEKKEQMEFPSFYVYRDRLAEEGKGAKNK